MEGLTASGTQPSGAWAQSLRLAFGFVGVAVGVLALGWAASNIREIPPDSRAVVLRLGRVVHQQGAGLLVAWPPPLERVLVLPAADRQLALRIARFDAGPEGQGADRAGLSGATASLSVDPDPRRNTGFLLTSDGGVVHLTATLFYQITDPAAYVLARAHVPAALERLFIAAAVAVCATHETDALLVARPERATGGRADAGNGREQLRADLLRAVNQRLAALAAQGAGLGVSVSRVDLAATLPGDVKLAFDQVLTVSQAAEETIAQARTYAETKSQEAAQRRDRILAEARAGAAERRAAAEVRTAAVLALAQPGAVAPDGPTTGHMLEGALLDRVYFERIGSLLRRARQVDAIDPRGGLRLLLPGAGK